MKKISVETLKSIADKLLFDLSEEEYLSLVKDFDVLNKQIELFSNIEGIDGVEPQLYPYPISLDSLREDAVNDVINQEEALKNAPEVLDGMIKLPRK